MANDETPKKPASPPSKKSSRPTSVNPKSPSSASVGSSAKANLRGRVPIGNNADLSKTQKTKGVVKGAVKGAQGKNAAGGVAGGQLTGAAAGAAQALLSQTKGKTIIIFGAVFTLTPLIAIMTAMIVISSVLSNAMSSQSAGAAQAVSTSTDVSSSSLATVENAALYTSTPWTVLEATIYYETGAGASVAQRRGICPVGSNAASLCPATLSVQPGSPYTPGDRR